MEEKILQMLKELQPIFDFNENVNFTEKGYLDSFDIVTLIRLLEDEFSVSISALETIPENFASVNAIRALVLRSGKNSKIVTKQTNI